MSQKTKILLYEPESIHPARYFSIRLKENLLVQPSVYRQTSKIIVISELNGDFNTLKNLLITYKVIDQKYRWTFGQGHLVFLGNLFDNKGHAVECLWLIYALEEKAIKHGGYVHFILGNNEIKNITGAWRFNSPHYAPKRQNSKSIYVVLYDAHNEIYRWMKTKNIAEIIDNMLFTHSSNIQLIAKTNLSIQEINRLQHLPLTNKTNLSDLNDRKCDLEFISIDKFIATVKERHRVTKLILGYNQSAQINSLSNELYINMNCHLVYQSNVYQHQLKNKN